MRGILKFLLLPVRLLRLLSKSILVLLLVATIGLNIASLTSGAVFGALSTALAAATGVKTVYARHGTRVATLTGEARALKRANSNLVRDRTQTAAQMKNQKLLVSRSAARISRRTLVTAQRNLAAMAGEAVPFYGVGVIIAATLWELHDACNNLKDMHTLNVSFNPEQATPDDRDTVCAMQVPTLDELKTVFRE